MSTADLPKCAHGVYVDEWCGECQKHAAEEDRMAMEQIEAAEAAEDDDQEPPRYPYWGGLDRQPGEPTEEEW
jgi:hypothetical protein